MKHLPVLLLAVVLLSCNLIQPAAQAIPSASAPTENGALETAVAATVTALAQPAHEHAAETPHAATPTEDTYGAATPSHATPAAGSRPDVPDEAILILEPGPGSRVVSPVRVAGMADPTFEQNLVIRIVADDGTLLAETSTTIHADVGQRGPFEVDVPFTVTAERQALIQVSTSSARDGGVTHLSSAGVTLAPSGPNIRPAGPVHAERIYIITPLLTDRISGGVAHVEGYGVASFEQTFVVQVLDANGAVLGQAPVTLDAPDHGVPGNFSVDIPYTVSGEQPGRILVVDQSASGAGYVHVSSVEVTLAP